MAYKCDSEVNFFNPSKFEGCLIGSLIGDALGYQVEFSTFQDIHSLSNISDLSYKNTLFSNLVEVSDDTQMTFHTLLALYDHLFFNIPLEDSIKKQYSIWFTTQEDPKYNRAPGMTIMDSIYYNTPIASEGSGAVMKTSPVGLLFSPSLAFDIGWRVAAITYDDIVAQSSAAFLSMFISYLYNDYPFTEALSSSLNYLSSVDGCTTTYNFIISAISLSKRSLSTEDVLPELLDGFRSQSALALSIFSILRSNLDIPSSLLYSVTHSGDSDTVASITGAILGAYYGIESFPKSIYSHTEFVPAYKYVTSLFQNARLQ